MAERPSIPIPRQFLTLEAVARQLDCSPEQVTEMIKRGSISGAVIDGTILIDQ